MKFKIFDFLNRKMQPQDFETIGVKIGEAAAVRELAIFIAVSYIANTISKCEIKTYKGGKEVQEELYYALNVNPNPNQNSSQFMNKLVEQYYLSGSALVVPHRNRLYVADGFSEQKNPLGENTFESVSIEEHSMAKSFKASEVFYFRLDNRNVTSLVRSMYSDLGSAIEAAFRSFTSANSEKYRLELENYQAGDPLFAEMFENVVKQQLKSFLESDRAVYPQFRGTKLEPMQKGGASATSADISALRKEAFDVTAQAFKIPLSMMYGNITNMNEIVKVYLGICIDPLAQMLSEELTRKTTDFDSWKAGDRVVVDTSKINHIDVMEVADKVDKLISSGSMCIDEVRDRLGMEALNTDFSKAHFVTKNYGQMDTELDSLEGGESDAQ